MIVNYLNNSRFFTGCIMILMNVGGRHITKDIPKNADKIFEHWLMRGILVFCIAFTATRDVMTSAQITTLFFIIFKLFLNEKSKFCVVPKNVINLDIDGDGKITLDEIIQAQRIIDRYKKSLQK